MSYAYEYVLREGGHRRQDLLFLSGLLGNTYEKLPRRVSGTTAQTLEKVDVHGKRAHVPLWEIHVGERGVILFCVRNRLTLHATKNTHAAKYSSINTSAHSQMIHSDAPSHTGGAHMLTFSPVLLTLEVSFS